MNNSRIILAAAALLGLAACSSPDRVVLVSDPSGHVGRVEVKSAGGSQILEQAKTGTSVAGTAAPPTAPEAVTDQTIAQVWGSALGAMPPRPQTTLLYFKTGSADLRDESLPEIPRVAALLKDWAHPHVLVVGHADGTGSDQTNLAISRQRAEKVRDLLVGMGVPASEVEVTSHGKRNPLIPTPDGVPEPRNRRVSVTIQ